MEAYLACVFVVNFVVVFVDVSFVVVVVVVMLTLSDFFPRGRIYLPVVILKNILLHKPYFCIVHICIPITFFYMVITTSAF
jgi:hypothetical protein